MTHLCPTEAEMLRKAMVLAECQYLGCGGNLSAGEVIEAMRKILNDALNTTVYVVERPRSAGCCEKGLNMKTDVDRKSAAPPCSAILEQATWEFSAWSHWRQCAEGRVEEMRARALDGRERYVTNVKWRIIQVIDVIE